MKIYNPQAYSCTPVRAMCKSINENTMSIDFLCAEDRDYDDHLSIIFDHVDQDRIRRACEAFNAIMVEASIRELATDFLGYRYNEGEGNPDAPPHRTDDQAVIRAMRGEDVGICVRRDRRNVPKTLPMPDSKIEITEAMVEAAFAAYVDPARKGVRTGLRAALTAAFALVTPGAGFRVGAEWAAGMAEQLYRRSGPAIRAALAALPFDRITALYDAESSEVGDDISVSLAVDLVAARDEIRRLKTALAALPEGGDGWREIGTVPHDQDVLVTDGAGVWQDIFMDDNDGNAVWDIRDPSAPQPTYWQPLPLPPAISPGGGT